MNIIIIMSSLLITQSIVTLFTRKKLSSLPTNLICYIFVMSNICYSVRLLLCESLFNAVSFSNIEMQNVGII